MDNSLQQLEAELKQLRPVSPSVVLTARIERDLQRGGRGRSGRNAHRNWWWLASLPAAATIAFFLQRPTGVPPSDLAPAWASATVAEVAPSSATSALKPVAMENVLYSATDEGLVTLEDGTPARRERLRFVDTITWKNPRTNASLQWTVPREEVRVVPVVFR